MYKDDEIKKESGKEKKIPLECPPRDNKTAVEPIEDMKDKIEF